MAMIVVEDIGKAYRQYRSRWGRLFEWLLPLARPRHHLKWVLKNISFSVSPGEAVGIIGLNGAGKSTLLKIITGTTLATTGRIKITGRVAALLELGMGFHPDFTGRQNVIMAGQLLGLSVADLMRLMPEIESFAEIGEYMDEPVRIYSSGMQVRLAFSVATAVRPDILIVDEALSVGDVYFQHKSFQRIKAFRESGTTLLIVSHDKSAIQTVCDRAILLSGGTIAMEGDPEAIFDFYNAQLAAHQESNSVECIDLGAGGKIRVESGSREATIESIAIYSTSGRRLSVVSVGEPIQIRIRVKIHSEIKGLVLGYGIKDRLGQVMFGTNTYHTKQKIYDCHEGEEYEFTVSFNANLGVGSYSVQAALVENSDHLDKNYHWIDIGYVFEVINTDKVVFSGCMWNEMNFSISRL